MSRRPRVDGEGQILLGFGSVDIRVSRRVYDRGPTLTPNNAIDLGTIPQIKRWSCRRGNLKAPRQRPLAKLFADLPGPAR